MHSARAQQDPMYSQYMFNMLSVNPAFAGSRETLTATALYRKQWVGIDGAPTTVTFSADGPIRNQRMALGINIVSDRIGISKTTMINASYAYRVMLVNGGVLSLGLQGGINQYRADYSSVQTYYPGLDPPQIDQAFASSEGSLFPNFGFGAYYYTGRFFVGMGVPKMLKNNLTGTNSPTIDFTSYPNRQNRHLFITSGYSFDMNQDWTLKPSLLIKGVHGAPLEMDVNVNAWWRQKVGAGLSYRSADAMVAMLQFQAKPEINFGYAYDMTLSKFSGTNSGSHELMVRFEPHAKKMQAKQAYNKQKKNSYNKAKKKRKPAFKKNRRKIGRVRR
jgi:type IX secretion system PorP/SprF family membrane protein